VLKELLISFLICLVIGAIINGWNASAPAPGGSAPETSLPAPSGEDGVTGSPSAEPDKGGTPSQKQELQSKKAPETSDNTFDRDVLGSSLPVLVDFNTAQCAACQMMAPIVDTLAVDYAGRARIFKVEINSSPVVTERFHITLLPTFMMFRNGRAVSPPYSGAMAKEMLAGVIDRQLGVQ
jgi:thioredoxin 1